MRRIRTLERVVGADPEGSIGGEDLEADAVAHFDRERGIWWAEIGSEGYRYVPKNACVGRSPKPLQNRCSTCVLASPALGCRQLRLTTPRYTCHRMKLCRMRATSSNSSQRH